MPAASVGVLLAELPPPPPPHAASANAETEISKQTESAPFGVAAHTFTTYPADYFFANHVDFVFSHGIDRGTAPLRRQTALEHSLRIAASITGNPAVVGRTL